MLRNRGGRDRKGAELVRMPVDRMGAARRAGGLLVDSAGRRMTSSDTDWSAFYGQLRSFVASRVRSASDVDDLVQVILERAMSKSVDTEIDHVAGWLFGIARNAIADHYRVQARTLIANADALDAADAPLGSSDEERAAVIGCMEPLLRTLPSDVAQLLRWADMEGRAMQSIADELGIGLSATKSRVQRARREFVKTTSACCAITVDARGRVTDLTRKGNASDCGSCEAGEPGESGEPCEPPNKRIP